MRAYLINLPEAGDRLTAAEAELDRLDLPFVVVEAIRGKELDYPIAEFSEAGYKLLQGRRRIDAEVGCYLSHLKAIQCFLDSGEEHGLILEDDIKLSDNLKEIISIAYKSASFDLLRLSSVNTGRWSRTIPLVDGYFLGVAFTREKGAGAYVLNRRAAETILAHYLPMKLPYDHRFDLEWLDGMRTLGVSPPPVNQSGFESQIQHNIRSYYYPAYLRYWTVLPSRAFWEVSRMLFRSYSYLKLKAEQAGLYKRRVT